MQVYSVSNHTFAIPKQVTNRQETIEFINTILSDPKVDSLLHRLALSLLLDLIRPEFPTKSIRDVITGFARLHTETFSLLSPNDAATYELLSRRQYTLVALAIGHQDPFAKLNKLVSQYCKKKKFENYLDKVLKNNVVIDLLAEPLERLPYARTRVSGKHFPRIIIDLKGRVYDPNGIICENLNYDIKKSLITEINSGIQFVVPSIQCDTSILQTGIFKDLVAFGWLYGQAQEKTVISFDTEQMFLRSFNLRPIFEDDTSSQVTLPTLFPIEFVTDAKREIPTSISFHEEISKMGDFNSCFVTLSPKENRVNFVISRNSLTSKVLINGFT